MTKKLIQLFEEAGVKAEEPVPDGVAAAVVLAGQQVNNRSILTTQSSA